MLKAARIPKTYDVYLAEAKFYSIIVAIIGAVIGFAIYPFLKPYLVKLTQAYKPTFPVSASLPVQLNLNLPAINFPVNLVEILFILILAIIFSTLFYFITTAAFLAYPSIKADDRKREIERMLPHVVNYMYALSKGGIGILDIVQSLSRHKDVYGEAAEEFRFVVDQMEYFGVDLHSAMMELYEITPSSTLKDLISGLLTTIDSGGDISVFFAHKSEQYAEKAKTEQKSFLETLGLLAEIYITAAVTAPIFLFIILSIMVAMGEGDVRSLYAVAYLLIPLGSLMFAGVVYMITPKDIEKAVILKLGSEEKEEVSESVKESELYKKYAKAKARKKILQTLKSPLIIIREKPVYVLIISIPIAIAYVYLFIRVARPDFVLVTAAIIALTPLALFYELKKRRMDKLKNQVPDFLKGLAGICATGATLQQAIEIISETGKGGIYDEVKIMRRNLEWGAELIEAFAEFSNRLKVPSLSRAVVILMDVIRIGGDITETLHLCGRDAELERNLAKERRINMLIYTIIIYMAFFTFLGIMAMLFAKFFPSMFQSGGSVLFKKGVDKDELVWILTQATLLQGLFSGIVAGVMGEGDALSGIKHSIIMLACVMGVIPFLI